ncbi:MAG TPA: hypothetical protein VKU86_10900 [Acidimicrobiales bacterium]|nr:hypothetical protein [Acidimicrobiales bacterium]
MATGSGADQPEPLGLGAPVVVVVEGGGGEAVVDVAACDSGCDTDGELLHDVAAAASATPTTATPSRGVHR